MRQARTEDRSAAPSAPARLRDRRALLALVLLTVLGAGAVGLALSHADQRRSGTNGVIPLSVFGVGGKGTSFCQHNELVPEATSALRVGIGAEPPLTERVAITLRQGERVIARTVAAGWRGETAEAPIPTTTRDLEGVDVCFRVLRGEVGVIGGPRPANTGTVTIGGRTEDASIPIEYLRAGQESWWSYAPTMARRMGLGRGEVRGGWVVLLVALLTAASLALVARSVLRGVVSDRGVGDDVPAARPDPGASPWARLRAARRRLPPAALTMFAIGVLNAAAWSLLTPMFQGPDEITHVAYAQRIAETGRLPIDEPQTTFAPELKIVVGDVRVGLIGRGFQHAALWLEPEQRRLDRHLNGSLSREGGTDVGGADPEPPLFYALQAIPYTVASSATLLDRVALMRLLSALMAGFTALFTFLFVRECLPAKPWAWTVGGLGGAFVPMYGFVSGMVNPDALLFAVCAALFWGVAHAFRHGMTRRTAIWLGVALAVGALGKINFYGLVPGALIAIALAARASEGAWNAQALRLLSIVGVVGAAPYVLMTILDAAVWERSFILANTPAAIQRERGGLGHQLGDLWQVYLPRLPWQDPAFEVAPNYELWFKTFVGKFGPLLAGFPTWAYRLALALVAAVCALAVLALVRGRAEVRSRREELLGYLLMAGGLLLLIALVAIRGWAPGIAAAAQGRYLLPLLAPFALVLALAARAAGDRWGRTVGVAIVVAAVLWTLFGQLATISYYYA